MNNEPLVIFENATIARAGMPVLRQFSWEWREGETWAVVGPMGSGKSTFLEAILGKHHTSEGEQLWPLLETLRQKGRAVAYPSEVMRMVSFKEESRLFSYSGHYYQQRFEFADADEPLTLDQFLHAGARATEEEVATVAERLGIGGLRSLSFIKLSNGQTRRARIARALLGHPEVLLLDDPFMGLDVEGRAELGRFLEELVQHGHRLILAVDETMVPEWVTNVLTLGQTVEAVGDRYVWESIPKSKPESGSHQPIIELSHATVKHGGKTILDDVSWTVRAGERWALTGPNGAGKSTLLSLVCGDHPQAYANDMRLFGQRRGTGESIWDVKRRIGFVSPEFHLYFSGSLTAFEVAVTGFYDVLAFREATEEQARMVYGLFGDFGISNTKSGFRRLSTGQQRLVLLVRALVKQPPLLILDEPFQGFDTAIVRRIRSWLERQLLPEQTLIFVTHRAEELPSTITQHLRLEAGRVAE